MKTIAQAFLLMLITGCFVSVISAATFVVNTTADTLDANLGNGICEDAGSQCSLRAAISEANALSGPDIITLAAATYTQGIPNDGVNETNLNGDLDVTSEITINGVSEAATIIEAAMSRLSGTDRVLDVRPGGNLTLNNATVRHGRTVSGLPPSGGGIHSSGTLSLNNVTVTDNETGGGEGIGGGGGIGNDGPLVTLNNTTVTGNFASNIGASVFGGGFSSFTTPPSAPATININNSTISGNFTHGANDSGSGAFINGIYHFSALGSHFDNNTSNANTKSTGTGLQALNFSSGLSTLSIVNCTFNGNAGSTGSFGATGGGIQIDTYSSSNAAINATLDGVTVNGNTAANIGVDGGSGVKAIANGGAITLDVRNTTISNNSGAPFGGGMFLTSFGGSNSSSISAYLLNSTFSGNSANTGGALATQLGGQFVNTIIDACTITNNSAVNDSGGVSNFGGGSTFFTRSVVAGNTAPSGPDAFGGVLSLDYNHFGSTSGIQFSGAVLHNTTGNAMLGALANNGGPTLTHMPTVGSPVIDAIPLGNNGCQPVPAIGPLYGDQRGFGRPFGAGCDKGSVERGASLAAGPWTLSGTVKTTTGIPIRNVAVQISGGNLPAPVTVFTGNLGAYLFSNLTGNDYTVTVTAKRYHFNDSLLVFSLGSNITNADFVANAPFTREARGQNPKR
jgi:large repetitive protein